MISKPADRIVVEVEIIPAPATIEPKRDDAAHPNRFLQFVSRRGARSSGCIEQEKPGRLFWARKDAIERFLISLRPQRVVKTIQAGTKPRHIRDTPHPPPL